MSWKLESGCVGCDLPCLKHGCPYYQIEVAYCDHCGNIAYYILDNEDLCADCAEKVLQDSFNELDIKSKAECLDIDLQEIDK